MRTHPIACLLLLTPALLCGQNWVQVDFNTTATAPAAGWNSVATPTDAPPATPIALTDAAGGATSVRLGVAYLSDSTSSGSSGALAATLFDKAAGDYFFVRKSMNGVTNIAYVVLSGLSNDVPYAVQVVAATASAATTELTWRGAYQVNGSPAVGSVDGQGYRARQDGHDAGLVMTWNPVYANNGQVVITVTQLGFSGNDAALINAVRIGPAYSLPPPPVLQTPFAVSDSDARLSWTGSYPAGTAFWANFTDGATARTWLMGTNYTCLLPSLLPDTSYTVRIHASIGGTATPWSNTRTLRTTAASAGAIAIDFNGVTAATGWTVLSSPITQTIGGRTFTFANFSGSTAGGHAGRFSGTLFGAAANDYFFVHGTAGLTGTLTISGLRDRRHRVQLCASASTANGDRIGNYRINGAYATVAPTGQSFDSHASGYNEGRVLTWPSVHASGGTLTLTVEAPGTLYAMLNGMRLTELPSTGTVVLVH